MYVQPLGRVCQLNSPALLENDVLAPLANSSLVFGQIFGVKSTGFHFFSNDV